MEVQVDARRSCLSIAASLGHDNLVAMLLEAGATNEAVARMHREWSWHALNSTIEGRHHSTVDLIPTKYTDIVIRQSDHKLRVSLHLAIELGMPAIVEVLLRHGTEINARNRWSETPLHCAARRTNKIGVASLECRLDNDALVDPYDLNAITPLNLSAMSDNLQAVEILLCYRADVDGKQGV